MDKKGGIFPPKRKLVKRMIFDHIVKSIATLLCSHHHLSENLKRSPKKVKNMKIFPHEGHQLSSRPYPDDHYWITTQNVINLTSITGSYLFSFPLWLWSKRLVLIVVLHHMIALTVLRLNFSVWNNRVPCIIIMAVPVIGQYVHLPWEKI